MLSKSKELRRRKLKGYIDEFEKISITIPTLIGFPRFFSVPPCLRGGFWLLVLYSPWRTKSGRNSKLSTPCLHFQVRDRASPCQCCSARQTGQSYRGPEARRFHHPRRRQAANGLQLRLRAH